jgi:hypothetical protein
LWNGIISLLLMYGDGVDALKLGAFMSFMPSIIHVFHRVQAFGIHRRIPARLHTPLYDPLGLRAPGHQVPGDPSLVLGAASHPGGAHVDIM